MDEQSTHKRYPVVDRLLHKPETNGRDYYTLGSASTERGAVRVLRKAGRTNVTEAVLNMRGEWVARENSLKQLKAMLNQQMADWIGFLPPPPRRPAPATDLSDPEPPE